jgi:hypothetical protein
MRDSQLNLQKSDLTTTEKYLTTRKGILQEKVSSRKGILHTHTGTCVCVMCVCVCVCQQGARGTLMRDPPQLS